MDRKIRVLQVVTRLVRRGVPRHVLDLAAGLDSNRFDVDVLAGSGSPDEGSRWEEARDRGLQVVHVPELFREVRPLSDIRAFRKIRNRIRSGAYQIVHTHISKAGILGRLAARSAGVPVVAHTYHGVVEETSDNSWRGHLFLRCERLAARNTDALIAVSHDTRRACLEHRIGSPTQYSVIHNGINLREFDGCPLGTLPPDLAGKRLIGAVGSLTSEKGVEILLQALDRLATDYDDLHLCVLGDGPLRSILESAAASMQNGGRVSFHGNVEDVRPWLGAFELLVLPSYREGLPTVVIEAMAMSRPVVATRVGGVPEIVEHDDTGLLAGFAKLANELVKQIEKGGQRP